ncbi:MAG: rhodanese-like domain-containing protein [Candidatus Riflebacteria bacterium]|nr:rhodanese-like domain-containing protein [Candidatus Riflebacteria bacterium]
MAIVACASVCAALQASWTHLTSRAALAPVIAAVQTAPAEQTAQSSGALAASTAPTAVVAVPATLPRSAPGPDLRTLLEPAATTAAIPRINLAQAKRLYDSGSAVFVDARTNVEYEVGHLPGALPDLTLEGAATARRRLEPYPGKVVVTYCHGTDCHLSDKAAETLFEWGFTRVCIFFGGWDEWRTAGYPVETGKRQPN